MNIELVKYNFARSWWSRFWVRYKNDVIVWLFVIAALLLAIKLQP